MNSVKTFNVNKSTVLCMSLIILGGVVLIASEEVSAQTVQRLFSTPAQRAQLDRIRSRRDEPVVENSGIQLPIIDIPFFEEEEVIDIVYAHGGTVQSANGTLTVWLNGKPLAAEDLPANIELLSPFNQGQLRIRNEATGDTFDLKPGQVLNLTRGELLESYQVPPEPPEVPMGTAASTAAVSATSAEIDLATVERMIEQAPID